MATFVSKILSASALDAAELPEAPSKYNGAPCVLALSGVQTFVEDCNMMVIGDDKQIDLRKTIARMVRVHCDNLGKQAITGITAEELADLIQAVGVRIAQFELLALISHSRVNQRKVELEMRTSDFITEDKFLDEFKVLEEQTEQEPEADTASLSSAGEDDEPEDDSGQDTDGQAADGQPVAGVRRAPSNGLLGKCYKMADAIYHALLNDQNDVSNMRANAAFVTYTVVANALHRHGTNGHNFITRGLNDPTTVASKMPALAGAQNKEFANFLKHWGHDAWHFLSDVGLTKLANIITGEHTAVAEAQSKYEGMDVSNQQIHILLKLPESVTDRYPPGTLGVSSLIIGIDFVKAMFNSIFIHMSSDQLPFIIRSLTAMKNYISNSSIERQDLLALRQHMGPTVAFSLGYAMRKRNGIDRVDSSPSLAQFRKNHVDQVEDGLTLGRTIEELKMDPLSVKNLVISLMNNVVSSVGVFNATLGQNLEVIQDEVTLKMPAPKENSERIEAVIKVKKALDEANMTKQEVDNFDI